MERRNRERIEQFREERDADGNPLDVLEPVTSEYIGETEENLANQLDSSEAVEGTLLFDEADALLGKRSEVKDSHNRYANQDVNQAEPALGSVNQKIEWTAPEERETSIEDAEAGQPLDVQSAQVLDAAAEVVETTTADVPLLAHEELEPVTDTLLETPDTVDDDDPLDVIQAAM